MTGFAIGALVAGVLASVAGGFVQGCAGFGFALVATPVMMMALPPATVVPVQIMLSTANTAVVLVGCWRHARASIVLPMALGSFLGLPVGIALLEAFNGPILKIAVGVFVLVLAAILASGWRRPVHNKRVGMVMVGIMSGVLGGSISIGGPPVVLFLANEDTPKEVFRASLIGFFLSMNLVALAMMGYKGLLKPEVFGWAGIFLPLLIAGTFAGMFASRRISDSLFKRASLVLVAVTGGVLLVRSVFELTGS